VRPTAQLPQLAQALGAHLPGYLQWQALARACQLYPGQCSTGLQYAATTSYAQGRQPR
jgi:hypothetical protein